MRNGKQDNEVEAVRKFRCERIDSDEWKAEADAHAWQGLWPVIDGDMRLTGEVTDCAEDRYWNYDDVAMIDIDDAREAGWTERNDRAVPPDHVLRNEEG